jgi:hypothetical protein
LYLIQSVDFSDPKLASGVAIEVYAVKWAAFDRVVTQAYCYAESPEAPKLKTIQIYTIIQCIEYVASTDWKSRLHDLNRRVSEGVGQSFYICCLLGVRTTRMF